MIITIFSDTHLGFQPEQREKEAFEQAFSALNLAIQKKADVILHCGDLFDKSVPLQETWHEAFKLFSLSRYTENSQVKVFDKENKPVFFQGVPVIAIHGTHEYRGKEFKNALQVLEKAGFVLYLHASFFVLKKESEKIAVHGLGGVPEKVAKNVLMQWNPKPVENAKNIVLLHQSFKEFLPFEDEMIATLSVSDLPENFDLFVNGHIHFSNFLEQENKKLLFTGSTIITQMKELEATKPKLVHFLDTKTMEIESIPIPNQKKFFFKKVVCENLEPIEVQEKIFSELKKVNCEKKPLVKVKVKGVMPKGFSKKDIDLTSIQQGFAGKMLLYIDLDLKDTEFQKAILELKELHERKKSVSKLGLEILEKNLKQTSFSNSFDFEELFNLLSQGETDKALKLLSKE